MENGIIISSLHDFPSIIESVSNYDVLLTVSSSEPPWTMADFSLDPTQHHIGNNRFRIMCQMHSDNIVVYDMIARHPCLDIMDGPQRGGTFLCRDGVHWRELPKECALAFVKLQVTNNSAVSNGEGESSNNGEDEGMKRRRRSSLLRRSLSSGNMLEDQKKRFAFRRSLLLSDVSSDEEEETEGAKGDAVPETSFPLDTSSSGMSTSRRSTLERSPSWSEGMDEQVTMVHTANALDVIFTKSTLASRVQYHLVSSHHTGNNRLLVMVQLRLSKFLVVQELDTDPQQLNTKSLCTELVTAVKDNYNGRFLAEPEVDKDYFILLTDEQAAAAIQCLFQSEAELEASANEKASATTVNVEPNSAPTTNAASSNSSMIQNNGRTPSLIKRETMQQLHELSTSLNDVISSNPDVVFEMGRKKPEGGIHKFALESLQKRKKRQGLTNKISQMVAYNPSAAAVTSRVERRSSVSELPRRGMGGISRWASTGHCVDEQPHDWPSSASAGLSDTAEFSSMRHLGPLNQESHASSTIPEWDEALFEPTDFGLSDVPIREQMRINNAVLEQHPFHQLQQEPLRRRPSALSRFSQVMIQDMLLKDGNDDWDILALELANEGAVQSLTGPVDTSVVPNTNSGRNVYERTEI